MKACNKFLIGTLFCLSAQAFAHGDMDLSKFNPKSDEADVFLTIGADAIHATKMTFKNNVEVLDVQDGVALIRTKQSGIEYISHLMHDQFRRCGGFMAHDEIEAAEFEMMAQNTRLVAKKALFADYTLDQHETVEALMAQVNEANIKATIEKLSSYKNRYHKAPTGKQSQQWLKDAWSELARGRNDVKVEFFDHGRKTPQPSVILTITGAVNPEEIIVVGGHADSINGMFFPSANPAPGADDNASGIASTTEIIRVLMDNSYRPSKTLQFMGYAAEEVGLVGSKDIAQKYKAQGRKVVGVLQLDMTNYKGSEDFDMILINDFTNRDQNTFLATIIDEYLVGLTWGYDKCGYACSDHASWHSAGYPASMPSEAKFKDMNPNLHTANDVIGISRGTASHAAKFTKLGLGFVVELDR